MLSILPEVQTLASLSQVKRDKRVAPQSYADLVSGVVRVCIDNLADFCRAISSASSHASLIAFLRLSPLGATT